MNSENCVGILGIKLNWTRFNCFTKLIWYTPVSGDVTRKHIPIHTQWMDILNTFGIQRNLKPQFSIVDGGGGQNGIMKIPMSQSRLIVPFVDRVTVTSSTICVIDDVENLFSNRFSPKKHIRECFHLSFIGFQFILNKASFNNDFDVSIS